MAKKTYNSPFFFTLNPGEDPGIILRPSQGTSGEDSQFRFDPAIDPDEIDLFWGNYDETDLAAMDENEDLYISAAEWNAWKASEQPW